MTAEYSFVRYLSAKQTVDDRALNANVRDAFVRALPHATSAAPLQVIEVGAGIGTMLERLASRGILRHARYTAIDAEPENIAELNRRLPEWAEGHAFSVETLPSNDAGIQRTRLSSATQDLVVESQATDVFDLIADARERRVWNVLIAHAVLDLFDVPRALPQLFALLRSGGLFYFTVNFDGATIFEPAIDPAFDAEIERLYHQTMDARLVNGARSGDSRTGRHLFSLLRQNGAEIVEAGSSDWVVFGGPHGYPGDEAYFLHFIVNTVRGALEQQSALAHRRDQFLAWIAQRHRQIEDGTLVYIAHQLDFVGQRTPQTR